MPTQMASVGESYTQVGPNGNGTAQILLQPQESGCRFAIAATTPANTMLGIYLPPGKAANLIPDTGENVYCRTDVGQVNITYVT